MAGRAALQETTAAVLRTNQTLCRHDAGEPYNVVRARGTQRPRHAVRVGCAVRVSQPGGDEEGALNNHTCKPLLCTEDTHADALLGLTVQAATSALGKWFLKKQEKKQVPAISCCLPCNSPCHGLASLRAAEGPTKQLHLEVCIQMVTLAWAVAGVIPLPTWLLYAAACEVSVRCDF